MPRGTVREYNLQRGAGTIESETGGEVSVHRTGLREGEQNGLHPGDIVEYRIGRNPFGRSTAVDVVRVGWEEDGGYDDDTPREWNF